MSRTRTLLLLTFFTFCGLSVQEDPLKDFCRLFGHQTAVVDRQLYIDGGYVNWSPVSDSSINYTSTWLRNGHLDTENEGFPQESLLTKNATVPSVAGGILWPDTANKILYSYGGEYGNGQPEDYKMWYYDIVYNTWNVSNSTETDIQRAAWGAGATAQDRALGFYYGGWLNNKSVPYYASETALSTLLIYDMLADTFRNETGPDDIPRAEGAMVYLPTGAGMLVYFGGIQQPYGNSTIEGANMTDIHMYSIFDNKWYTEKATGDVPDPRRRFCAGVAWSDDRSSYNIYIFGGASVGDGVGFGDVYVLSLPSYRWIKFWPTDADNNFDPTGTHHSLTCDVVNSQMIIMGGQFTQKTACDAPAMYGQHGLDLGKSNPSQAKWATFNPSLTTYQVPAEITSTIGGSGAGGATALSPSPTWANEGMPAYFSEPYTPSTRAATRALTVQTSNPTSSSPGTSSGKSNNGAIIGGAVGGSLGALALVGLIGFCLLRKKRRDKAQAEARPTSELPADGKSPMAYGSPLESGHTSATYDGSSTYFGAYSRNTAPYEVTGESSPGLSPYGSPRRSEFSGPPQEMPAHGLRSPHGSVAMHTPRSEKDHDMNTVASQDARADNWFTQNAPKK
ncbi:hypothetical protein K491DRAFT_665552 [Lophiostoma macrostomum CBS 122681]|uniref:Galactose oxidase n=1 Tax=Lophiostoma macrostomum CBS 122681 TaxID=1314788 RepID=A0A6A6SUG7_9PLEO|nr:hypothetical protein K491DRAFT_665552 [Lophiostoma macrostomum CBS 122681]